MRRKTKALMFSGTGSGVGKSVLAAAFCRILRRQGVRVAPFKAQNMALNSFVTLDGLEMGRAQVYQAEACGLEPDVRMNPILLKPSSDSRSQVVVMGKPVDTAGAVDYYSRYEYHRKVARDAFDSLAGDYDFIVMEGAGSPAEINLQKTDIVNMAMAAYAESPVVLIGDIDRGGVFAWLKGTYDLVPDLSRGLIAGFIINKFRGDISLLSPGLEQFRHLVDLPVFGVLPWFSDITPDQEDGVFVNAVGSPGMQDGLAEDTMIHIKVIRLPRISNFTDLAPFSVEEDVRLEFVERPSRLGRCDCLIIPGSKATLADMRFLDETGWTECVKALAEDTVVAGVCGGYQMLGESVCDPSGIEGEPGSVRGLGLLPVTTVIMDEKKLSRTTATLNMPPVTEKLLSVQGYEIHMGETAFVSEGVSPVHLNMGAEFGAMNTSGSVWGMYLHGIFDNDEFRKAFLDFLRRRKGIPVRNSLISYRDFRTEQLDRLADWFEKGVDVDALMQLAGL